MVVRISLLVIDNDRYNSMEFAMFTKQALAVQISRIYIPNAHCVIFPNGYFSLKRYAIIFKIKRIHGNPCKRRSNQSNGLIKFPRISIDTFSTIWGCLLYTSPSPRDGLLPRMP